MGRVAVGRPGESGVVGTERPDRCLGTGGGFSSGSISSGGTVCVRERGTV